MVSGQAHGAGHEVDLDSLWSFGPGWHQVTVEVGDGGAQGWYDGQPLPHTQPFLTVATHVEFFNGWNSDGASVWDDFEAAAIPDLPPSQSGPSSQPSASSSAGGDGADKQLSLDNPAFRGPRSRQELQSR